LSDPTFAVCVNDYLKSFFYLKNYFFPNSRLDLAAAVGEGVRVDRDGDGAAQVDGLRRSAVGLLKATRRKLPHGRPQVKQLFFCRS
jgi:hypothetical protein